MIKSVLLIHALYSKFLRLKVDFARALRLIFELLKKALRKSDPLKEIDLFPRIFLITNITEVF